jgi:GntR family transcriptional regulator
MGAERRQTLSERHAIPYEGPLYEQVHKVLRARIEAGEWGPREPLPGEVLLSHQLGVSVGTVRKAMDQLARESVVTRQRGRGTFVRGAVSGKPSSMCTLKPSRDGAHPPTIVVLDCQVSPATDSEASALRIQPRHSFSTAVLRVRRRWIDGAHPICFETIVVDAARFPRLRELIDEKAETLFAVYADAYRIFVDRVKWEIATPARATSTDQDFPDGPQILVTRTAFDNRGAPIELCTQLAIPSRCTVQIER